MEQEIIRQIYDGAKALGACDKLKQGAMIQELAALIYTQQGRQFCEDKAFPTLDLWRQFKPYMPEQYGVFVDAGEVTIYNNDCYLIGDTTAVVRVDGVETCHIVAMYGARVKVEATNGAIIRGRAIGATIDITADQYSIVL